MAQTRRQFCRTVAATAVASLTPALLVPHQAQASTTQVGNATITTYSDGMMRVPTSMLFNAENNPEIAALLEQSGMAEGNASRPLNITLAEIGDRKVLFDAGSGVNFLPGLGELPAELDAAGIDTDSITDIVFTHAHPDHIWGILDDFDDLMMPDANYHISQAEWVFWDSDDALAAMPEGRENFAVGAKSRFDAFRDQVSLFEFGAEIIPGVEAVRSTGHTPGHASFAVHSGNDSLMVLGDALTHPLISFQHPMFRNNADMDADAAAYSRASLLDRMHADAMQLVGYHLPAPGIGRVEKSGATYLYTAS